ncbi:NADP-dependent oxidoreductase domain-containing protein [Kockiozyma suomiensis]|uniref:NADP-dependent oxidoreductase domain-containing protein n=1 Tax=Kockiozyma suomiensis TaxID=1337062 RepID=UPI00334429EF
MVGVEYRRVGMSGLRVSVPILGMMSMGSSEWEPWVLDKDEALPILKRAYDLGVTTWDTANAYSNGESEILIREAIKTYNIPREELTILTKIYYPVPKQKRLGEAFLVDLRQDPMFVNQFGLSRGAIFKQVDECLERLGTDYIDLLQIHRLDKAVEAEEVMEALNDLVRSGKVRYIGASSMWTYEFVQLQHVAEMHGWSKFISMQDIYNLVYREEEREMIPYCNSTGVGLLPWSPLHQGILARPLAVAENKAPESTRAQGTGVFKQYVPDEGGKEIVRRLEEVAKKKGWSMAVTALVWLREKVVAPVVGINSLKRLEEAIEINGKELTAEEQKYLEAPYLPQAVFGHF